MSLRVRPPSRQRGQSCYVRHHCTRRSDPGGYICEIIRSGIESVDPGQMEAARSIGFGPVRSMMMIVVPQAVKNILPNFGNEFTNLIQASSQVMVIGAGQS
ncbi:MAG: ABC transporter permease subunit [Butyricicoccaceae bacterium]